MVLASVVEIESKNHGFTIKKLKQRLSFLGLKEPRTVSPSSELLSGAYVVSLLTHFHFDTNVCQFCGTGLLDFCWLYGCSRNSVKLAIRKNQIAILIWVESGLPNSLLHL
jgi:hypothetical protein